MFFTIMLLNSCKKENDNADCGCKTAITDTIPETNMINGVLGFKHKGRNSDYLTNRYWITVSSPNSAQVHHAIICNYDIIPNNIINYLNNHDSVNVNFSGYLKNVCDHPFTTANITYNRITLTKIKKL